MKDPFIVIKLEKVVNAPMSQAVKVFYAFFKILLVNPQNKEPKKYILTITADNDYVVSQLDRIFEGDLPENSDNATIKELINDVKELNPSFPLQTYRKGREYDWYLFEKMLETYKGIMEQDEKEVMSDLQSDYARVIKGKLNE